MILSSEIWGGGWCGSGDAAPEMLASMPMPEIRRRSPQDDLLSQIKQMIARNLPQVHQTAHESVALMTVRGVLTQRTTVFSTGADDVLRTARQLASDPLVENLVIDIDVHGGSAFGVVCMARGIRELRKWVKVTAFINSTADGAGYALASAADEIVIRPGGQAGGIGITMRHVDYSRANDMAGVKPTYLFCGRHKAEANPDNPLTDPARQHLQETAAVQYGQLVREIAAGRGIPPHYVRERFGGGRLVTWDRAVELGMADRVGSLSDVLKSLTPPPRKKPVDATRKVSGWAAKFGVVSHVSPVDGARWILEPGCLDEADMSQVVGCIEHDQRLPWAHTKDDTLTLSLRPDGLYFDAVLSTAPWGKTVRDRVLSGELPKCSFRFDVAEHYYTESRGILFRHITRISRVKDVCLSDHPLFPQTSATVTKTIAEMRKELELMAH